jgi:death-on-curing protein
MRLLTKRVVIFINKRTVDNHGGNFNPPNNFLNEAPLDYLIDIVNSEIFGKPLYPKLSDKAGLYMFNIISNHIFSDGNKRTGLGAALIFLRLNGFKLKKELRKVIYQHQDLLTLQSLPYKGSTTNEILEAFTLEIASGKGSLQLCQAWFEANIVEV